MEEELHIEQEVPQMAKEKVELEGQGQNDIQKQPVWNKKVIKNSSNKIKLNIQVEELHIELQAHCMTKEQLEVEGVEMEFAVEVEERPKL